MPTIITSGAASARAYGFGAGASGFGPVPDASIIIGNSTLLGTVDLTARGITGPSGVLGSSNNPYVMTISDNGLYLFMSDYGSSTLYRFDLSVPYDITTVSGTPSDQVNLGILGQMGGSWNTTGTRFSLRQWSSGPMYVWNTTNWSLSGFSGSSVAGPTSTSYVAAVDNSGLYAYAGIGGNVSNIGQLNASGAWGTFPGSFNSSFDTGQSGNIYCTFPSGGRTRLFQICDDSNLIQQVNMPAAGSLGSASNAGTLSYSPYIFASRRNTMGVMVSDNKYWYMLAQRGGDTSRYISWWRTGS